MSSRKSKRMEQLLRVLDGAQFSIPAQTLARMLGTTERTIRNYVSEINQSGEATIVSSSEGYRLRKSDKTAATNNQEENRPATQENEQQSRVSHVIYRLIGSKEALSLFDLAEELCVSESTLASTVMPAVRSLAAQYDLSLETHNFNVSLEGPEREKRKLLGHLATQEGNDSFSSIETLRLLFPDYDVDSMLSRIVDIFQHRELLINDYALNNLMLHILIVVSRLQSKNPLADNDTLADVNQVLEQFNQSKDILSAAQDISTYLEQDYGCKIPDADFKQIVLLVALSTERYPYEELDVKSLAKIVGEPFAQSVHDIARETAECYGIPMFDERLILQLTLHMFNAYQRAKYNVSYANPLADQIKVEYPPIYDMGVHFAHRFSKAFGCRIDENEIALIAFHIGAYLERCSSDNESLTCIIVVEQYHDFAGQLAESVKETLGTTGTVIGIMNRDAYLRMRPECDLVISTMDIPTGNSQQVVVGPILNERWSRKIREAADNALERKRRKEALLFLESIVRPELYARNARVEGADGCIDYLGALCRENGYADDAFINEVHLRESMSSTALTDSLALPHSLGKNAIKSFIAVIHNDSPIAWGNKRVNFVLLIGIAQEDMRHFRDAFDIIVETFTSMDKTANLMATDSFEDFVAAFTSEG